MAQDYTNEPNAILEAEKNHIRQDYEKADQKQDFSGLSLSGGGIRSASFCLGIIQALVSGGTLKKIDYLSTASGGGYMGSALTWFLNQGLPDGTPAGTDITNFPLGRARTGARNQKENPNAILDFLRQHGCYLTPNNNLDLASTVGYSIRTIFVSFLVYFAILSSVVMLLEWAQLFTKPFPLAGKPLELVPNWFLLGSLIIVGLFVVISIGYSLLTRLPGRSALRYSIRVYHQVLLGLLLKFSAVLLVLGSLPLVYHLYEVHLFGIDMFGEAETHFRVGTAGGSTLLGGLMGWLQYRREKKKTQNSTSKGSSLNSIVAALLIIYGLLLGAFILTEHINNLNDWPYALSLGAVILSASVLAVCVNVNYASLHRMYRDRLMEAFLPDKESVNNNRWGLSQAADSALIETMCQPPNRRPYHLINTNLVLADSTASKYRGRGGDNFILSPLYCGSDATGWRKSSAYMKKGTRGMTLGSAMAISGAAVNPNAANNGRGVGRNQWVSILFTLLNLRLGYWALNPKFEDGKFTPNFIRPSLTQGILFKGLKESKRVVELTDGGHFENLAVYELIRRKLKVIIACDGGADGLYTFDDLGNMIEKVRVDFGAKIVFDDPELDLRDILPNTSENKVIAEKYGTAKRGFAVATINYADGSTGKLIYIKATMIEGLSTDIYSYKSADPTFPHQATSDQFFDEVQIEAYRELGYYLGWKMLEANGCSDTGEPIDPTKPGRWI